MFEDRFGALRRQFELEVEGTWDGAILTLVERFAYDDGQREQRTWRIEKVGAQGYRGRAEGVIGVAEGSVDSNVLDWRYRYALPVGDRIWTVSFADRLVLRGDGILINRAKVSKFGLLVGQLTCMFRRLSS